MKIYNIYHKGIHTISDLSFVLPDHSININPDTKKSNANNANLVHIRIYQRTSRRYITTIEDLVMDIDMMSKMTKAMKKKFSCNGCVKDLKSSNEDKAKLKKIISLTGDQRDNIKDFLVKHKIVEESQIKTHGF